MGNRHFDGRINRLIPCTGMKNDTSSSDASSFRPASSSSSGSGSDAESNTEPAFDINDTATKVNVIEACLEETRLHVYAVEKRNSRELYAMKLINKDSKEDLIISIMNEIEILTSLSHPFVVTLWFAFQDDETIYLIFELLPGGDLRRCLQEQSHLPEAQVLIYISELALALDYLKSKRILHRDIKPENLLLDGQGRIRLTDFNIAIELKEGELATSMSGTKPYIVRLQDPQKNSITLLSISSGATVEKTANLDKNIPIAPEVYKCNLNLGPGYSYPADWWSLGVCAYELVCGERPYDIHSRTSLEDTLGIILLRKLTFPKRITNGMIDLIQQILCIDSEQRLSSSDQVYKHPYLEGIDFDQIYKQKVAENPSFNHSSEN